MAKHAGVNVQTLRYYERRGVIETPTRSRSGHREYPADMVPLLLFIKRAQRLGFTLDEVIGLIRMRERAGQNRTEVQALARAKIREIDEKLAQLQEMRRDLEELVTACTCVSPHVVACPIVSALDGRIALPMRNGAASDGRVPDTDPLSGGGD